MIGRNVPLFQVLHKLGGFGMDFECADEDLHGRRRDGLDGHQPQ